MNNITIYNSVKDQMKTGDQLGFQNTSLISKLIIWRTGNDGPIQLSHWGGIIRMTEYEGLERRRFTLEALNIGFYPDCLTNYIKNYSGHIWWFPLKDEWNLKRQLLGERAMALIGTKYDYKSLFKQVLGSVSSDVNKLFCSEAWFIIMGMQGKAPNPTQMPSLGVYKEPVKLI
jgi:hypothetical protein